MAFLYNIPNSTTGMDDTLVELAGTSNQFIPIFLFFLFVIIFVGGSTSQKRRTGFSDWSLWALLSMVAVLMVSLGFSLISGLISQTTLVIVFVITLLTAVWYFFSTRQGEV